MHYPNPLTIILALSVVGLNELIYPIDQEPVAQDMMIIDMHGGKVDEDMSLRKRQDVGSTVDPCQTPEGKRAAQADVPRTTIVDPVSSMTLSRQLTDCTVTYRP